MNTSEEDPWQRRGALFAVPDEGKEPLSDAAHVRKAIARFDQVEGVSDGERDAAWKRIMAAAEKFDIEVSESGWRELFKKRESQKTAKATEQTVHCSSHTGWNAELEF
jgi:hypothetical protein